MYSVKKISTWDIGVDIETSIPCELYVDCFPNSQKTSIRILWVVEPNGVSGIKEKVINRQNEFDLILTFDEDILKNCQNSQLFTYGTTWIVDFDTKIKKEFCITSLIGGKRLSYNHTLRQQLPSLIKNINNIPVDLYNSINQPFHNSEILKTIKSRDRKNELFYSQYHISIENFNTNNYFSEKLIDCFQTKTVPLYIGCPNISDFFDTRGMFIVNTLEELIEVIKDLESETYNNMLKYVEINYELSKNYTDIRGRLKNVVYKFVNESHL